MQVNLKVIGGKNDGRMIGIAVSEFIIGRGEQAHLRPQANSLAGNIVRSRFKMDR